MPRRPSAHRILNAFVGRAAFTSMIDNRLATSTVIVLMTISYEFLLTNIIIIVSK